MIDKSKALSVTGHRVVPKNFDVNELKKVIYKSISDGFDTFLCGMALGFDTLCFSIFEEARKVHPIKIIACVPCPTQSMYFKKKQKAAYERMLDSADEVIIVSPFYFEGCMQVRNEFMVDNSSRLICLLNFNHGGTFNTVKYAVSQEVEIVYLGSCHL